LFFAPASAAEPRIRGRIMMLHLNLRAPADKGGAPPERSEISSG
jgi:hypothetical protein